MHFCSGQKEGEEKEEKKEKKKGKGNTMKACQGSDWMNRDTLTERRRCFTKESGGTFLMYFYLRKEGHREDCPVSHFYKIMRNSMCGCAFVCVRMM